MHRPALLAFAFTSVLACSSEPAADDEAGTTTSPSTTDADESTSDESTSTSTSTTNDDEPTVGTSSSSDDDTGPFLPFPDVNEAIECDSFVQDCPNGEKCVPYASGGGTWDGLECVPILGDHSAGEDCQYDGPAASTDDCDGTSWCWDSDVDGEGVCRPFCTGTPDMPECPPMSQCTISGDGVINICLPTCDPVIQDCSDGLACYWTGNEFNCVPSAGDIPPGDTCSFANECSEGSICADPSVMPNCDGPGCCASFCDLELGDSQCAGVAGTVCVPFYEQDPPPEYAHVGLCILPP